MFDTRMFNTSDLMDATLTLVELQEAQLRADESGAPYDAAADEALTDSCDRFYYLIAEALEEGDSESLEDAINTLTAADKLDASEFLEKAVQSAACHSYDEDGNLLETKLFPVLVSRETCHESLTLHQCKTLSDIYKKHHPDKNFTRVAVGKRLRDAEEIYSLRFHDVRELNDTGRAGFGHLATQGLQVFNDRLFHPVLRFFMVQTTTAIADGADVELEQDFQDSLGIASAEPDSPAVTSPKELARNLANELAVLYGTPLICGTAGNLFVARREAMLMYAHTVARLSINRQLDSAQSKPVSVMATLHTDFDEGPESQVSQIRVSLVDAEKKVIAGHILECGEWFTEEDAEDLSMEICKWAKLNGFDRADGVIEILDQDLEPFFCNGENWEQLPSDSLRLDQAIFG